MIGKEREESEIVGHTRMDGRMNDKVIRNLMTEVMVEEAGKEVKDVLIVRLSRKGYCIERR